MSPRQTTFVSFNTHPGVGLLSHVQQGITAAAPGSAAGGAESSPTSRRAHDEPVGRGIEASEVWHGAPFPSEARPKGPGPERASYGSFGVRWRPKCQDRARAVTRQGYSASPSV